MTTILQQNLKKLLLGALTGIAAGALVAIFLHLLDWATNIRAEHPELLFLLPLFGYLIGYFYANYAKGVGAGNAMILDRIHALGDYIPKRMMPFVLFSTILTHLGGGSAGREGTAVQMSAAMADQIAKYTKLTPRERNALLIAGIGAGFGAAFGAPLSGIVFGLEVVTIGGLAWSALGETTVASFLAVYTVKLLQVHHGEYPIPDVVSYTYRNLFFLVLAGLAFGLAAGAFASAVHIVEKTVKKMITRADLRPLLMGVLLLVLFRWEASGRFYGLGFSEIHEAFHSPSSFSLPAWKSFFTALTLGGGFKGGEFIPLVYLGSTLGSAMSTMLQLPASLLAALGFVACFGAVANTPLTAVVLAFEAFGYHVVPFAFIVCYTAYFVTAEEGIYHGQKVRRVKPITKLRQRFFPPPRP